MKNLNRKDNEAFAIAKNMRVSPSKANLVLEMIRGKKASDAINALKFSNRAIAKDIGKVLNSAVANAENNHQLDIDILKVTEGLLWQRDGYETLEGKSKRKTRKNS